MIQEVFADVLLGLAVAVVLASALGILVMRGVYRKLHFVKPGRAGRAGPRWPWRRCPARVWTKTRAKPCLALLFMVIAGP